MGSDHQSLQWLSTQNVATLSYRLLRWVEFFSLLYFVQEYLPGQANVLPDYLSRPATEVLIVTVAGSEKLHLFALAGLLHDGQEAIPSPLSLCAVLDEWPVETDFYSRQQAAQAADPHLGEITTTLGTTSTACMPNAICGSQRFCGAGSGWAPAHCGSFGAPSVQRSVNCFVTREDTRGGTGRWQR